MRASVVIVHGFGEHSGRHAHVAKALVDAGCAVYALDLRGHGQSEGSRAMIDRFSHAVDDINQLVEKVRKSIQESRSSCLATAWVVRCRCAMH